ncbi:hypothetical protein [Kineococcus esterisolvens]|uniref:hypothetical protein n=1 Tax=unclassified Kineococcus TaxID=2621656 RepID=UPI003D7DE8A8
MAGRSAPAGRGGDGRLRGDPAGDDEAGAGTAGAGDEVGTAGAGDEVGTDGAGDAQAPAGPWAAWLLALAPVVPVLLAGESCRRFLAGARDRQHFGWRLGDLPADGGPDGGAPALGLTDRWPAMLGVVPAGSALLASLVGLLAVTGAVLVGRPGWLVPGPVQRWAAAASAGVVALGALGLAVGSLATVSASGEGDAGLPYFVLDTWGWLEASVPLGTALLTAVLAVLCAVVLLRPGRSPATLPGPGPEPLEPVERVEPVEPAGPPAAAPGPRGAEPGPGPAPASRAEGALAAAADGPPRLRAEDRALYRRPGRVAEPPAVGEAH